MDTPFSEVAKQAVTNPNAVILDVRRDDEWAAGHADRATHWELARLQAGELPDISKDAQVYTYCAAGKRAGEAADILRSHGWTNVQNAGGFSDWVAAGGATVK
ncbi:MAG TPA: rhodanese-like domain-containing protein [Candidatus Paceibacterota bacterium]|nr:rhodanese-like domain-containing protein [Candidatus Paceibacterota bacterium]